MANMRIHSASRNAHPSRAHARSKVCSVARSLYQLGGVGDAVATGRCAFPLQCNVVSRTISRAQQGAPTRRSGGVDGVVLETLTPSALSAAPMVHNPGAHGAPKLLAHSSRISATTDRRTRRHAMYTLFRKQLAAITQVIKR